jgi:aryl-alcohol dehydrogenase-like predicted oxidoreductase
VQSEYSLWSRDPEVDGVLEVCQELGIGFLAYSPLGRGFLTGQIKKLDDFAESDWRRRSPRFQDENFQRNLDLVARIIELAEERRVAPAQLALAWVMAKSSHVVPIPGTKRRKYLEENLKAVELTLSASDVASIEAEFPFGAALGTRYPAATMGGIGR